MSDRDVVIRVENISKLYRLGEVGTGSLAHDVNRWWHRVRGKEDPYLKIGEVNDRTKTVSSVQSPESSAKNANALDPRRSSLDSSAPAPDSRPSPLVSAPKAPPSDWVYALKDVSFEVKRGEVLGIIGRNGAGKSTLLKILSRVTTQSSGQIKVKGRIASLLEVGTGFHPELTGRENIFLNGAILGMRKAEIARKFDEIVEFSGCARYIDTPVKRYSSGMYVRLAFAVAAHLEPEILIVDEVLAVGDAEFQKKCLGKMKDVAGGGRTVLFVSHNIAAMKTICDKAVLLNKGTIETKGNINNVVDIYLKDNGSSFTSKTLLDISKADVNIGYASLVSIEDINGNQINKIKCGDPWKVKVVLHVKTRLESFIASVGLKTIEGHTCRVSWSDPCILETGQYSIEIIEKNISISKGFYKLVIGMSNNKKAFHYQEECCDIQVIDSGIQWAQYNIAGTILNQMETKIKKVSNDS